MPPADDLVFVGDVHLDRGDPELPDFLETLTRLGRTARRIVLLGDLFNLWLAERGLEQEHHRLVIEAIDAIRREGTECHYLEGNRDYRVGKAHAGSTFDAVSDRGLDESWAGERIWAAHGDLVNVHDRSYRMWRRLSRTSAVWGALSLVPLRSRFAIGESIERRLRGTNAGMKQASPIEAIRAYATPFIDAGYRAVVLGHFHQELELDVVGASGLRGRVRVLPLWKDGRRHLRRSASGIWRFEGA